MSHIPVLKSENRKRSTSLARTSSKFVPKPLQRTRSSEYLQPKRSNSFVRRTTRTPTHLETPSTSRSRSRSPLRTNSVIKSERNVLFNDKRWVAEQHAKVRHFLQKYIAGYDEQIPELKPPSINTFICITDSLFKKIDPQLSINNETYKTKVAVIMKDLQYPGNITNSLMKTVNTNYAWPQVIGIWSWLVDLITHIKSPSPILNLEDVEREKFAVQECVLKHLMQRFVLYNDQLDPAGADEEFFKNIVSIMKFDRETGIELQKDVDDFKAMKEKKSEEFSANRSENDEKESTIQKLGVEVELWRTTEDQIDREQEDAKTQLNERKLKLLDANEEKKQNILKIKEQIKQQLCTYEEKNKLLESIDLLKHTNNLKGESLETYKKIKSDHDFDLVEAKKQVETEVHHLNDKLVELNMNDETLSVTLCRNTGFTSADFKLEIEKLSNNISYLKSRYENIVRNLDNVLHSKISNINIMTAKMEEVKEELNHISAKEQETETLIKKTEADINNILKIRQQEKELHNQKINDLASSYPDIVGAKLKFAQLTENLKRIQADSENIQTLALGFLSKFCDNVIKHTEVKNEILRNLLNMIEITTAKVLDEQMDLFNAVEDLKSIMRKKY